MSNLKKIMKSIKDGCGFISKKVLSAILGAILGLGALALGLGILFIWLWTYILDDLPLEEKFGTSVIPWRYIRPGNSF